MGPCATSKDTQYHHVARLAARRGASRDLQGDKCSEAMAEDGEGQRSVDVEGKQGTVQHPKARGCLPTHTLQPLLGPDDYGRPYNKVGITVAAAGELAVQLRQARWHRVPLDGHGMGHQSQSSNAWDRAQHPKTHGTIMSPTQKSSGRGQTGSCALRKGRSDVDKDGHKEMIPGNASSMTVFELRRGPVCMPWKTRSLPLPSSQ